MVGLRRTNSCETCRRRRVKCDEVRPICGACAKSRRECTESPPPSLIWMKQKGLGSSGKGPKIRSSAVLKDSPIIIAHRPKEQLIVAQPSRLVPRSPGLTRAELLQSRFVEACECPLEGFRLSNFSQPLICIPKYLGVSAVLDQSVQCFLYIHDNVIKETEGDRVPVNLYHTTLRSLQSVLNSPEEANLSTTLCAVAILGYAEALGKSSWDTNYSLTRVVPQRGSKHAASNGESQLTPVYILTALLNGKECFLAEPSWAEATFNQPTSSLVQRTINKLFHQYCLLVSILKHVRDLDATSPSPLSAQMLFDTASRLRCRVCQIRDSLQRINVNDKSHYRSVPSKGENSLTASTYCFQDRPLSWAYTYCWALIILANGIIARVYRHLMQHQPQTPRPYGFLDTLAAESKENGRNIFKSLQFADRFAPLGSMYMSLPAILAYSSVEEEMKPQIADQLKALNRGLFDSFSAPVLDYCAKWLLGDAVNIKGATPY
ncbi:hypothetical protein FDECE_3337 [Fusarium decemcellulare]|nr:hypothetical protein FDECE_3337 [Fusarium decemcellulare]